MIILMLMMSAGRQHHPCDLITSHLGRSVLAAAEHLGAGGRAHLASEQRRALPGRKQMFSCQKALIFIFFWTRAGTLWSLGPEFHDDPNQK